MLEGKIAISDPKPSVDTNDGSPVSKFELTESPTKASYKEALERSSPPTSQTSSASASSPSTSAGSIAQLFPLPILQLLAVLLLLSKVQNHHLLLLK